MTHFLQFLGPNRIFVMGEAKHFKFGVQIDTDEYWCTLACMIDYARTELCSGHMTSSYLGNNW